VHPPINIDGFSFICIGISGHALGCFTILYVVELANYIPRITNSKNIKHSDYRNGINNIFLV
jgi:hypothetical protein